MISSSPVLGHESRDRSLNQGVHLVNSMLPRHYLMARDHSHFHGGEADPECASGILYWHSHSGTFIMELNSCIQLQSQDVFSMKPPLFVPKARLITHHLSRIMNTDSKICVA